MYKGYVSYTTDQSPSIPYDKAGRSYFTQEAADTYIEFVGEDPSAHPSLKPVTSMQHAEIDISLARFSKPSVLNNRLGRLYHEGVEDAIKVIESMLDYDTNTAWGKSPKASHQ